VPHRRRVGSGRVWGRTAAPASSSRIVRSGTESGEAELLPGAEHGAADLVSAAGEVDDWQGEERGELTREIDGGRRERRALGVGERGGKMGEREERARVWGVPQGTTVFCGYQLDLDELRSSIRASLLIPALRRFSYALSSAEMGRTGLKNTGSPQNLGWEESF
jgi:hypothetical protein